MVAVVIPVHNRLEKTRQCLESLDAKTHGGQRVFVVDDGSTDGTADYLASLGEDVETVNGDGDYWWTRSVDVGCQAAISAGADVIVLLNDDNVVAPGLVDVLVSTVRRTGGCVGAVVLDARDPATGRGRIYQAGGTLNWRRRGIGLRRTGEPYAPSDEIEECAWLPGCAMAFPAAAYDAVGGFDSAFPQYRGDIDFTLRARAAGFRTVVTHATWVVNDLSDSPLTFRRRVSLSEFVRGFWTRRSNYNLAETVRFARRHCPRRLQAFYVTQFYARYIWASLKSQRHALVRGPRLSRSA